MNGVFPVDELARDLGRRQAGEAPDAHVVRWLRAACERAASVPRPAGCDARRSYSRTLVHKCGDFEILVIHWDPNAESAIHDHGGARCWLAVAQGTIGVENFLRTDAGTSAGYAHIAADGRESLVPGAIDFRSDDVHLHRCYGTGEPAVSVHVYARPIERFYTFDRRAQTCAEAISTYDAILDASRV